MGRFKLLATLGYKMFTLSKIKINKGRKMAYRLYWR